MIIVCCISTVARVEFIGTSPNQYKHPWMALRCHNLTPRPHHLFAFGGKIQCAGCLTVGTNTNTHTLSHIQTKKRSSSKWTLINDSAVSADLCRAKVQAQKDVKAAAGKGTKERTTDKRPGWTENLKTSRTFRAPNRNWCVFFCLEVFVVS